MSSSPALEPSSPSTTPSSPALRSEYTQFHTSTPNYSSIGRVKQNQPPLNVVLPSSAPATPPIYGCEGTLTPPPRSPGAPVVTPASGDSRVQPPDGTSSDKSSETAVGGVSRTASTALSRKESYKAQRQHYRREKKRAASALLHSIEDPAVVVLADWLKVRGSLKSWTKLWCVLKPGLLLLYKSPKAKSSHWVGTVLLTSCQVIERPSKKDGFCFKLYHPLEQSIWAPRGPHNETIGAVVQPLPTAHLIFRAPSQAAGHCWLDGLELALRCSNAMLRCSRSRPEHAIAAEEPTTQTNISHEELEKHFNEHGQGLSDLSSCNSPILSVSAYSTKRIPKKLTTNEVTAKKPKLSKWAELFDSVDSASRDEDSTDSDSEKRSSLRDGLREKENDKIPERLKKDGFLDLLWKKDKPLKKNASTCSMKVPNQQGKVTQKSKSLLSSPNKVELSRRSPILKCFDVPKMVITHAEKRLSKEKLASPIDEKSSFMTYVKRRSSTPSTLKFPSQKTAKAMRESGVKTDSENDERFLKARLREKHGKKCVLLCGTPDNIIITKTSPSLERFSHSSSSNYENESSEYRNSPTYPHLAPTPDKFSVIDYDNLPSANFEASRNVRRDDRFTTQNVYIAGKIVKRELAGAASDTDSEGTQDGMPDSGQLDNAADRKRQVLARIESCYVEDPDRETGAAGELVEEVAEENKSLLWFLLKQVRPGMDLSKVVLPTFILEPRSFLDKLSDNYYHADILSQAQTMEDPYMRFKCVLRWYLSGLYRKPKGLKKPYNPVLGETFRCCWKHPQTDSYTYYVAEQVSHHPPISAFYVSNRKDGFVIEGSLLARSKFYGNSTSAILEGCARIHLLKLCETYVTTAPYAHCKGIVIGTLSMELGGKVHIMCASTGYQADVEFKLRSFLGSAEQTNAISGRIKKGKETVATVEGYWDGKIDIKDKKTGEESNLLDVAVLKEQRLTRFLMTLDQQKEFESQRLWMKVSEAILNDDQVAATEQKTIVEEAQRSRARNLAVPWVPRYFQRDLRVVPLDGIIDQGWEYNHTNMRQWSQEELIEYEEDFVITSVRRGVLQPRVSSDSHRRDRDLSQRPSDSDSRDELTRRSTKKTRTLKQALYALDSIIREQKVMVERLSKVIETVSENQRHANAYRMQNLGRVPITSYSWDLFAGFVLAIVVQTLIKWIFQKD